MNKMDPGRYMQMVWEKDFEPMMAERRMESQLLFALCRRLKRKLHPEVATRSAGPGDRVWLVPTTCK